MKSILIIDIGYMKSRSSILLIVLISLFVGLLHFLFGPQYQGIFRDFIRSYLIDILLPMDLYLLLQISLRKSFTIRQSRIIAISSVFIFGTFVEILQRNKIHFLGSTYDPMDILMYGIGIGLGVTVDLVIIDRLENNSKR